MIKKKEVFESISKFIKTMDNSNFNWKYIFNTLIINSFKFDQYLSSF